MSYRWHQPSGAVRSALPQRRTVGVLAGALLALLVVGPGLAATTASIANLTMAAATVTHATQNKGRTLTLSVTDTVGIGWNVTVQSSAMKYSGLYGSTPANDIPAANLSLGTPATPVSKSGQAIDATNGPKAVGVGGVLSAPIKVINANSGYGLGSYTQKLPLTVSIPANPRQGTYAATLTVTITAGP
jgi:hypothetical protein